MNWKHFYKQPFVSSALDLNARYISNLSATFFSQAITALSILLLTPHLLQTLGTEAFSKYGVILNLILFSAVFDFGLNTGLLRRLIHEEKNADFLINAVFFFFCIIFFLSIPIYYSLFKSGIVKLANPYIIASLLVALLVLQNIIAAFFDAIIQSENKIYVGKIIRILKTFLEFIAIYTIAQTGNVLYLLATTGAINFFYLGALYLYSQKIVKYRFLLQNFRFSVLKDHLKYSFWYFQNMAASVLVYNAQIILISNLVDSINVARYIVVAKFFEVVGTGINNFTTVLFPALSKLQAEGNWEHLQLMFKKVFLRVSILTVVAIVLVLSFGKQFFIYWSKYNDPITLQLFVLYSFFIGLMIIENVPNIFIMALKINKWPSLVSTLQGILGLVLCYFLTLRFGITGSIFAMLLAFLLTNCFFNPLYLWLHIKENSSKKP